MPIERHIHNGLGSDAPKIRYSDINNTPGPSFRSYQIPHDIMASIGSPFKVNNETYTVTSGKTAYVNSIYSSSDASGTHLTIDTVKCWGGSSNYDDGSVNSRIGHSHNPYLATASIVSSATTLTAVGFEVDEDADITPVSHKASSGVGGSPYTVPDGKIFVLLNVFSDSDTNDLITVIGVLDYTIALGKKNEYDAISGVFSGNPMIFNEGDVISTRSGGG